MKTENQALEPYLVKEVDSSKCNHRPILIERLNKDGVKQYVKWCYRCNQVVSIGEKTRLI